MDTFDVIWIGTGQATGTVVPRLAAAGKKIALIEGGKFGGTCVNDGCTPTKTLVASARVAHMARRSADFGVRTGTVDIDFAHVMERQNTMRHGASEGLERWLRGMENVTVIDGYAEFADAHSVRVHDRLLRADTIVIHAGGRSRVVPIPGLEDVDWLDNGGLLDLKELPQHLVIAGGSYIGLEFAQIFRRLGSEVTVIEYAPQLVFREDEEIATTIQQVLEREGVRFHLDARIVRVERSSSGEIEISYEQAGEQHSLPGSHLLLAVGRIPNSDRLNLDAAGVETDSRGFITVNEVMQTNVPHIYALGDINGQGAFTHTSVNDGEIFWDHYSGEGDRQLSDRVMSYAVFVDPPLGRVGMNEKEARQSGRRVLIATRPMRHISRAREKDEMDGLIKLLVDADTEEFLGATILGVGGDEIINMFAPFMLTKQSYKLFRKSVLTHPTVAELLPWILDDLKPLDQ